MGTLSRGSIIVADFGKTLSKLTLWTRGGQMVERLTRANAPVRACGYSALDAEGNETWLVESLCRFAHHPIEAIIPVSHGAAVAGICGDRLAFPPLDYEETIPDALVSSYNVGRDSFAITGSPSYPKGLNIGSQLHWLEQLHRVSFQQATLLPYAQYWAWVLSGAAVSEATSLGCHSDLWLPGAGTFSPMAHRRGWAQKFAPLARAGDVVGTLRAELAERTGLSPSVRVHAGIHDSNAALVAARGFPEIDGREATVLSTGTWFVAMRTPAQGSTVPALPENRDCLVNVDALGQPVPSARFMGGREIETLIEIDTRRVDVKPDQPALLDAVAEVLATGAMLCPTFAPGFGPFPTGRGKWINQPEDWHARRAAVCLYAALVANCSLALIETQGRLLIEGRFAQAEVFVRALASLRPDLGVYTADAHNDVSFGALRLIDPGLRPEGSLKRVAALDDDISAYASQWEKAVT